MAQVKGHRVGNAWVLALPSQLSADTEEPLLDQVRRGLDGACRLLVLDMTAVRLSDTAGMGTLVSAVHAARQAEVPVAVAGAAGRPRILLDRLQFERYARICGSVAEAVEGTGA